jgi:hypothetical protein
MPYAGPITCPNCQCPISDEHRVCPYCYSTAPATAPWQAWGSGWELQAILVGALILCILCDLFLDTRIFPTVAGWFSKADEI